MDADELLAGARCLVDRLEKPNQADLRRAQSAAYYAMFHTLAKSCADLLIGAEDADRRMPAWRQVYRALDHGQAKRHCSQPEIKKFPQSIQDFANTFAAMQIRRQSADYDPTYAATALEARYDIDAVESVVAEFLASPETHKRAFAAWVLFKFPR